MQSNSSNPGVVPEPLDSVASRRPAELHTSENYFRLLFEVSPIPMWVFETTHLRFLDVNQAACRHYGYDRLEFLQMSLLDIRPPSEVPPFLEYLKNAGQTPEQYQYSGDWIHQRKDGAQIILQITSHRFNYGGQNAVLSVMIDVTERRKTERALRESEDRFRLLSDAAVEAVLIHQNLIIMEVNKAFLSMLGFSNYADVVGKNIMDYVAPEYREMSLALVLAQSPNTYEMQLLRRDGTRVDIQVRGRAIKYQGSLARVATVTDITEPKRKEATLREREERLRVLCEQMPAVLWSTDKHLRLMALSGAALDRIGIRADQMLGRTVGDVLATFSRRPAKQHEDALGGKSVSFEVSLGERNFQTHIEPLRDAAGGVMGTVGVAMDITELKSVENQLRETANQLTRSNKELEQFAYVTSHDLQEPLRMVASYVALIEKRLGTALDEESIEYVRYAVDGAKRMKLLIDDLLAYSRVSASERTFREVDLEAVVNSCMRNLSLSVAESRARVQRSSLPFVWGDFTQLVTLFQNLIGNALKFRNSLPPLVEITASKADDGWLIAIQDNGIGFCPEYSQKIFRLFQRLHTKGEYSGTGIGLAICQKIVDAHGGRIWAESKPGEGAVFKFFLPSPLQRAS